MKKCTALMLAVFSLLSIASTALAQTSDAPQAEAGATVTVTGVDSLVFMNNRLGRVGMLERTCYTDGTSRFLVTLEKPVKLLSRQGLAVTPSGKSVYAIHYSNAYHEESVRQFSGWSSVGCGTPGAAFELVSLSQRGGRQVSSVIAYSVEQSKIVTNYFGAYLGGSNGRIGYLNEICYSDGTANISVYLYRGGIYLRARQTLTLTPALRKVYVVHYTASTNQYVQTISGWSSIGCVRPPRKLDLVTVSAPPPPLRWTVKAHAFWF